MEILQDFLHSFFVQISAHLSLSLSRFFSSVAVLLFLSSLSLCSFQFNSDGPYWHEIHTYLLPRQIYNTNANVKILTSLTKQKKKAVPKAVNRSYYPQISETVYLIKKVFFAAILLF